MPFVNIRTAKGLLTDTKKRELTEKLTELLVEIEGNGNPEFKQYVWILIEELEPENWCLGGTLVSKQIIKQLRNGVPE